MKKKTLKQTLSMIVVLTLLLGILPVNVWAADHVHDESCGYSPPADCNHTVCSTEVCGYVAEVTGNPCAHETGTHDGCGYVAEVPGTPCAHALGNHDAACGYHAGSACSMAGWTCDHATCGYAPAVICEVEDCTHESCGQTEGTPCPNANWTCSHEECGYVEAVACGHGENHNADCGYSAGTPGTPCGHTIHNSTCGYVEAVTGTACGHSHDATCGYSEGAACNYAVVPANEHTHVWSTEWSGNDSYHWHECIADGCDLIQSWGEGKGDYAKHEFDITRDTHSYIDNIGFGYHYGTCKLCGRSDSQIIIAATLQFDNTHHWYECPCSVIGWMAGPEKAEHSFDGDADMICDDCGYDRTPKSPASVTKAPEAITGLKFQEANGKEVEQILITAGEASGGTMVYRLSTDDEWSESIPVAGQARTHSVYYKVLGDSNHNDTEESFVAVTIAKADAPIVTIPAQKHFYTILTTGNRIDIKALLPKLCAIINEESEVTGTTGDFIENVTFNNGVLSYDTKTGTLGATGTITVKIGMRNYEDVTVTVNVELIDLNPVSNSGTNAEITYNGSTYDVAQMFTKDTNAGEVSYEIIGGSGIGELNGSVLTITKAGTIEIKMTTAANGNYAAGEVTATLTVNKADGTGTVSMDGWTYGENAKTPTTENGTGTAIFLYTGSGYSSANVPTDAGTYTVTVTFVENDLYKAATATDTFVIAQKELTPAITGSVSKTYDGTTDVPADHNLSVELAGIITSDDVSATATYAYASADIGTTKIVATITLNGSDAKNYKVATTASADVGEILPAPHVHSYGTEWKSDGNNHWHECSCGAKKDVAAHSGGKATCTEKAKCSVCGNSYGEKDSDNHSFTKYVSEKNATCKRNGTETAKCDHGCGKTDTRTDKGSKLGHNFVNGVCTRCRLSQWNPDTGDKIMIAVTTLALSGVALLLLLVLRKKKKR